jgi:hypothetical protein
MPAWVGADAAVPALARLNFASGTAATAGAAATSSCFRVTLDLGTSKPYFRRCVSATRLNEALGLVSLDGTPLGLRPLPPALEGVDFVDDLGGGFYMTAADAEVAPHQAWAHVH